MRLNTFAYYVDFFLAGAIIVALAVTTMVTTGAVGGVQWLLAAVAGFIAWTLFEYVVHRVLYHQVPYFVELHDAHHAEPDAFIGAPPVIGIIMILALSYLPLAAFSATLASGATAGMLAGYMGYMLLHHAAHHWKPEPGTWLYMARRHHALHHYHHDAEGNYGITTSFWDHVFGTALAPANPRQRRRAA